MERNLLLTVEYDGTDFSGWQRQPHAPSVQGELEKALSTVFMEPIKVLGTSRTDAGVHALGQRAGFRGEFGIPTDRVMVATNDVLGKNERYRGKPAPIRVTEVVEVPWDFHPRHDAIGKKYRYIINNSPEDNIFRRNYTCPFKQNLDVKAMKEGLKYLVGTHDFQCFQAAGGNIRETTVRTIYAISIVKDGDDIVIEVVGNGFLYNMVRIIVGTLIDIGLGKKKPNDIEKIIEDGDRKAAGLTAPPEGLYLVEIYYEKKTIDDAIKAMM